MKCVEKEAELEAFYLVYTGKPAAWLELCLDDFNNKVVGCGMGFLRNV